MDQDESAMWLNWINQEFPHDCQCRREKIWKEIQRMLGLGIPEVNIKELISSQYREIKGCSG